MHPWGGFKVELPRDDQSQIDPSVADVERETKDNFIRAVSRYRIDSSDIALAGELWRDENWSRTYYRIYRKSIRTICILFWGTTGYIIQTDRLLPHRETSGLLLHQGCYTWFWVVVYHCSGRSALVATISVDSSVDLHSLFFLGLTNSSTLSR